MKETQTDRTYRTNGKKDRYTDRKAEKQTKQTDRPVRPDRQGQTDIRD